LPELIGLLTHDLRNPLAALSANLNFVGSMLGDERTEVAMAMSDARAACALLDHLVANLDVLASSMKASPPPQRVIPLDDAVSASIARHDLEARVLEVAVHLVASEPCLHVLGDAALFGRALDNLLANALQHSPQGASVRVEIERRGERGVVTVLDQGPVVPESLRAEVLTAEGQSRSKQIRQGRYSRGLGLYSAARAAFLAGAAIEIGERDGGSEIVLSAPLLAEP
jgi:K+-sensing histidine kinase KdpD